MKESISRRVPGGVPIRIAVSVFVLLCLGVTARAQDPPASVPPQELVDLPLEDLLSLRVETVYAASRLSQEVSRAPASVTIISGEEIRHHGYRSLTEVLRSVRGLYVSNDRNYEYVGVRGFARPGDYNSRILMLVDGHRMNDVIYDSAPLGGESPLDIALIERVEVIRGPSSSVYGSTAFLAVINVITRTGASLGGVEVEGAIGTQDVWQGHVVAGGRSGRGVDGLLSIGGFRTGGADAIYFPEFDAGSGIDGVARGIDDESRVTVFGSLAAGAFKVQGGYGSRDKTIPTAPWETVFNDGDTRTRDARLFADLQVSRIVGGATLRARAAHDRYLYEGTFAYDTGPLIDEARGAWTTGEFGVVKWFTRHRLSAGAEYRENHQQDQAARDETGVLVDDARQSRTAAVYVEDEIRFDRHLALTAGARWDQYFNTFGGTVNPRLALVMTPFEGGAFKVLHGRAFRAPNPYELYYSQEPLSLGLQPERIVAGELVWEQRVAPRAYLTVSAFQSRVADLITQRTGSEASSDGLYFDNHAGRVRARGLEFEMEGDLPGWLHARGSWVHQVGVDRTTGERISNSPRNLGLFLLDVPIGRTGVQAALNAHYVGRRLSVHGTDVEAAVISNLTVSTRAAGRGFAWAVTARNLLGAEYGDPGAEEHLQSVIPQDGRTLSVRATWRF